MLHFESLFQEGLNSMDLKKMDALIEGWRDEILDTLSGWIAVPSVNAPAEGAGKPFGTNVRNMLDKALEDARKMGLQTREFDGFAGEVSLAGDGSAESENMGILAHLDVVPAGDGWVRPPFALTVENGRLYGRGVGDDKGPALAAMFAMRAVKEAGIPLKDSVKLILGCDEETGMTDLRHYAAVAGKTDYGFSPDADYPLINLEKGSASLLLSKLTGGEDGAEIPVYQLYAGERVNVVPGLAWAEVGLEKVDFAALNERLKAIETAHAAEKFSLSARETGAGRARIEAVGVSAHASMPELGVNAMGMLLIALKELGAGGGSREAIAILADKIGLEGDGKSLGIAISDEESGALTCNLGLCRYDGQYLTAQLDIRRPLCSDPAVISGNAAVALSPARMAVTLLGAKEAHYVPQDHKVVKGLLEVYHQVTGLPAYAFSIGGGTYSRMMPNTVAFGCNFPGEVDTAHMPDENVDLEKYMLSIRVMAHAIARLAGKEA